MIRLSSSMPVIAAGEIIITCLISPISIQTSSEDLSEVFLLMKRIESLRSWSLNFDGLVSCANAIEQSIRAPGSIAGIYPGVLYGIDVELPFIAAVLFKAGCRNTGRCSLSKLLSFYFHRSFTWTLKAEYLHLFENWINIRWWKLQRFPQFCNGAPLLTNFNIRNIINVIIHNLMHFCSGAFLLVPKSVYDRDEHFVAWIQNQCHTIEGNNDIFHNCQNIDPGL